MEMGRENENDGVTDIYREKQQSAPMYSNPMYSSPMSSTANPMHSGSRVAARPTVGGGSGDQFDEFDEEDLSSSAQERSR